MHISLQPPTVDDEQLSQDDLAHLSNVRAVRRVNVSSPVVTTPALTNEDSSQISSSGSGPTSLPENVHGGHQAGYYPRSYMNAVDQDPVFMADNVGRAHQEARRSMTHAGGNAGGHVMTDAGFGHSPPNNYGSDGHGPGLSHMTWPPGFLPDVPRHQDNQQSPVVDQTMAPWFHQQLPDPSFLHSDHDNLHGDSRHNRGETHHSHAFASHISPGTTAGLILPFDQLDAYGIFSDRHDLMGETGFDEQMPLLPGTNIEQFLASLDRNMA